jgi:hypothetical protein
MLVRLVAPWLCGLFAFAEEDVICGIGDAAKSAGLIARALGGAPVGVDPLHGGDIRERPASAAVHDVQLEPGDVVRRRAGRVADRLADDGAAVPMLPGWSGVMATDRLVVEKEGRDRLAKTMIDDLLWWTETLKTARTIAS